MTIVAVIPVKQLDNAKQRLAGVLSALERRELFRAMVEDVLNAVADCPLIDATLVVTGDPVVGDLGRGRHAEILPEPDEAGLIAAVTAAGEVLAARGDAAMVFVPGDVPLVTPGELEVVLTQFGRRDEAEFVIVPAKDLGGSNCVACSPPDCMRFGFGEDSFRRHLRFARELGIEPVVAKLPGLGLDVDTPEDLTRLIGDLGDRDLPTKTHHYLKSSGIMDRLSKDQQILPANPGSNHLEYTG